MRYVLLAEKEARPRLTTRTAEQGIHWTGIGGRTLLWTEPDDDSLARAVGKSRRDRVRVSAALAAVIQVGAAFQREHPEVPIVVDKGRHLIVDLGATEAARIERDDPCWTIRPLPVDAFLVERVSRRRAAPDPAIQAAVDDVTAASFRSWLDSLAGRLTRHSLTSHFISAAEWSRDHLHAWGYSVQMSTITVGAGTSRNVIADRAGSAAGAREVVIVTAHLDSVNSAAGVNAPAPGADDNGSGSAGVLEIARVLSTRPTAHDLRFILFGGEEQGLHGSLQYVAGLPTSERARVRAVLNMDMIATLNTASPTVLLEGAAVSQSFMNVLADAAATYTSLAVEQSLNPFASDHVPFIDAGLPAALTIEGSDSANTNVHTANDTLAHIDNDLALEILRMNVAAVSTMAQLTATTPVPGGSGPVLAGQPGQIDLFVTGMDSAVYHKRWNGTAWVPSTVDWEALGSPT
jgi:hypothetical protein